MFFFEKKNQKIFGPLGFGLGLAVELLSTSFYFFDKVLSATLAYA
jgi:hypothetical protein